MPVLTRIVLVVIAALFLAFLIYSVVPNLWVRVLHRRGVRRLPSTTTVALTFDDGPDPTYTPRLLDALRSYDVKATFFVIADKALQRPEIIERMLEEGHEVQIHGFHHWMVPLLLPKQTRKQASGAAQALAQRFPIQPTWYRPTWGLSNLVTLTSPACRALRLVTWSVMVGDWRVTPSSVLLERIVSQMRPGDIIVLHDSDETWGAEAGAPESVIALIPQLVESVTKQGLQLGTLSTLATEA